MKHFKSFTHHVEVVYCTVLVLLLLQPDVVYAQIDSCAISWDCPQQISHDPIFSCSPNVLSSGDTVHLFWWNDGGGPQGGYNYSRSTDGGNTFSSQLQIIQAESSAASGGASFAVWQNNVYVNYSARVDSPEWSEIGFLRSTDAGESWQPRKLLGGFGPYSIAAHEADVYLYVNYYDGYYLRGGLLRSHDYGSSWDTVFNLPTIVTTANLFVSPHALHMVMEKRPTGGDFETFYYRSTDGGQSLYLAETLSVNDRELSVRPQITGDDKGNVFVVWYDTKYGSIDDYHGSIILRKSIDEGVSWGNEQLLSYTPTAIVPSIAQYDSIVAIGWDEYGIVSDRSIVRTSFDLAQTWCDTSSVNNLGGGISVSLGEKNLSVVWGENINDEIHYRRGFLQNSRESKTVINSRWNMVSLPVNVKDKSKQSIFPNAISDAYAYENGVYSIKDTLKPGVGYWMKFATPETISLQGTTRYCDIVPVKKGWNLIGGISSPVALSSVNTNPINIIQSRLFSYYNGYRTVDTLMPGSGYWIKVKSDGELIISSCALCGEGLTGIKERSPP